MQGGVALDALMHEREDRFGRSGQPCTNSKTRCDQRDPDHEMERPSHAFSKRQKIGAPFLVSPTPMLRKKTRRAITSFDRLGL